jgi:hypothetical protein
MMKHGNVELLTRILGFAVLVFGVLALIGTANGTHPGPFVKWSSIALSAVITLVGWKLFRRKKAPKPIGQSPASPTVEAAPMRESSTKLPPHETAAGPATVPNPSSSATNGSPARPVVTTSAHKDLKKQNCAFEDLKHLVGIPHQKAKGRFNILLFDEAIVLADTKTRLEVYRLQWNLLEGVETSDSRSAQDQAPGNSLTTGAIGSGKIGIGGLLAVDLVNEVMSRHPLILRYRSHPKDPMSSAIVFDTFDNERIASSILAKRSALLADGKITFD